MGFKSVFVWLCLFELILTFCGAQLTIEQPDPSCTTPENEQGTCMPIKNCQSALDRLQRRTQEDYAYVRRLRCSGGSQIFVCCGKPPLPTSPVVDTPEDLMKHRNINRINAPKCGTINYDKISNGNITAVMEFPWMALISHRYRGDLAFKCAGTLINERYVLTAAHCVTGLKAGTSLAGVRLGEHNIRTVEDCRPLKNGRDCAPPVQDVGIANVVFHPDYNTKSYEYSDIALIRLKKPANVSRANISPICLPIGALLTRRPESSIGIVAGWGSTEKGDSSDVLLKTNLDIINNTVCAQTYTELKNIHFCGLGRDGHDACDGDSGGPLMTLESFANTIIYMQYGIVSAGTPLCGAFNRPVVFTNVPSYMKWILDNMDE